MERENHRYAGPITKYKGSASDGAHLSSISWRIFADQGPMTIIVITACVGTAMTFLAWMIGFFTAYWKKNRKIEASTLFVDRRLESYNEVILLSLVCVKLQLNPALTDPPATKFRPK